MSLLRDSPSRPAQVAPWVGQVVARQWSFLTIDTVRQRGDLPSIQKGEDAMAIEINVLAEDETGAWVTVSDEDVPYSYIAFVLPGEIPDRSDEVDIEVFLTALPLNRLHLEAQSVVLERLRLAAKRG